MSRQTSVRVRTNIQTNIHTHTHGKVTEEVLSHCVLVEVIYNTGAADETLLHSERLKKTNPMLSSGGLPWTKTGSRARSWMNVGLLGFIRSVPLAVVCKAIWSVQFIPERHNAKTYGKCPFCFFALCLVYPLNTVSFPLLSYPDM